MAVSVPKTSAPDRLRVRRALLSVSDKTGLADFAGSLSESGVELVSTGGTAAAIAAAGIAVRDVAELTGFPEIMDGRVKTLHPAVHGGLLGVRDDPEHAAAMARHGIEPIDLAVIDLYPFERVSRSGAAFAEALENIDIGGPAMVRAAAKNHAYVGVIVDPADYERVLEEMRRHDGALGLDMRRRLAAKAFARTAAYDTAVAGWLAAETKEREPEWRSFAGRRATSLRYGENPHQAAAFYVTGEARPGVATARLLQGKPLSYNNLNDTDAAFELVAEFDAELSAAVVIVKHANPCGAAVAATLREAYDRALACDPVSAFGGVVALNRALDGPTAEAIAGLFTEVVIAPGVTAEAAAILASKPNLRLLDAGGLPDPAAAGWNVRSLAGGLLVQERDGAMADAARMRVVTRRAPTPAESADLAFALRVAKHVKSNAIVYARGGATVGVGAGQMSRVDSARIAARKAEDVADAGEPATRGSVVASDAFFPFADGLVAVIDAGATAVIQPGGSLRDDEVIAAADARDVAMVFTGLRHFRH